MADSTSTRTPVTLGSKASWLAWTAKELGYFDDEGLDVTLLTKPALKAYEAEGNVVGVQVNWLQHAVYGTANGKPQIALMLLHDATGITVMVSEASKDKVRSAADFAGKRVAEGASHSSKGILTNYLAVREGVPTGSYTPVFSALEGRRENVVHALDEGEVDVLTFMEPMTTFVKSTGKVSVLYDFSTRESTLKEIGRVWPAECLLVNPDFLRENRDVVKGIVRALLRTMAYVHASSPEGIAEVAGNTEYFAGKDKEATIAEIAKRWPTLAHEYTFTEDEVQLVVDAIAAQTFAGDSDSAKARAKSQEKPIDAQSLYDNSFVENELVQSA